MNRTALLLLTLLSSPALAQNTFPTGGGGGPRVPGSVIMCLDAQGQAVAATAAGTCLGSGGGGGGGGAVTVADGADSTQGAVADAATTAGSTGTLSAKLRLMTSQLDAVSSVLGTVSASPTANTLADRLKTINTTLGTINTTLGTPMQATGGTVAATQSGTWNINNVSGTVSLPTGAATAAKQPALGTAGSASSDELTVQGAASMTALKVDGSGVTQPVSGTVTTTPPSNASSNIAQINGVTPLMGNGVTGTGSQRVTIASDNTAFPIKIASGGVASGAIASGAVASGAVASGAFASGSIAAGAVAAGATSFVKLEDVASADADAGVPAMAIRKAAPANTSGTDGDYEMLQMSAGRLWTSSDITIGGTAVDGNSGVKSAQTVRVVLATDQPQLTNKLLVTPDANSAVNVAQINGVTALMGNGVTGTGSQRVTVASDNTPFAVKIDQTTPGTTNLVYSIGSRPGIASWSVVPGQASYASVVMFGGLITISTGLPSGTVLFSPSARLIMPVAKQTVSAPTLLATWFNANPAASTFTDGSAININSADYTKVVHVVNAQATPNNGSTGVAAWSGGGPTKITVDGSGNIYLAIVAFSGTPAIASPPQTLNGLLEYTY